MKKLITIYLILSCLVISNFSVHADNNIKVYYQGKEITFDVPPRNINGRVLVPFRAIVENFGLKVIYEDINKPIKCINGEINIEMQIDNINASINSKTITLDTPPIIIDDRMLVPLRFVAEAFSKKVDWKDNTVFISDKETKNIVPEFKITEFLTDNFSELKTNIGVAKFSFNVIENKCSSYAYDYWIQVKYDYNFFSGAMMSIEYTDEQKNMLRQELKDFQEKIARSVINALPDRKFQGGYYDSWYKYPTLKLDLQTRRYYSWTNYDEPDFLKTESNDIYNSVKPSFFRWVAFRDDKL